MYISKVKKPDHFYTIHHPLRWWDQFSTPQGEERRVLLPSELGAKARRDRAYTEWLKNHNLRSILKFQAIRVVGLEFEEGLPTNAWWDGFRDCAFRVFVNPWTIYDEPTKTNYQAYILAPEDSEMVQRYRLAQKGAELQPRNPVTEPFLSNDPRLRKALVIPTACCHQLRHETTGGVLPQGL